MRIRARLRTARVSKHTNIAQRTHHVTTKRVTNSLTASHSARSSCVLQRLPSVCAREWHVCSPPPAVGTHLGQQSSAVGQSASNSKYRAIQQNQEGETSTIGLLSVRVACSPADSLFLFCSSLSRLIQHVENLLWMRKVIRSLVSDIEEFQSMKHVIDKP